MKHHVVCVPANQDQSYNLLLVPLHQGDPRGHIALTFPCPVKGAVTRYNVWFYNYFYQVTYTILGQGKLNVRNIVDS